MSSLGGAAELSRFVPGDVQQGSSLSLSLSPSRQRAPSPGRGAEPLEEAAAGQGASTQLSQAGPAPPSPDGEEYLLPTRSPTLLVLAIWHIGVPRGAAELEERLEAGCQKGMLSTESWGAGLLLLVAQGSAD